MAKDKNHAQWLEKDGKRNLYHGDDVADAKQAGWKKVEGVRGNGQPWNPEPEEGEEYPLDAVAEAAKASNEVAAEKAEKKAAKAEKARKEAEKNAPPPAPPTPDLRVQVVEPQKSKK